MTQAPYLLDRGSRTIVLRALREVCMHRGWVCWTNPVHVVVEVEGNTAREKQERFQVKCQPGFEPARAKALGTPWQHPMAMEGSSCAGSERVCR